MIIERVKTIVVTTYDGGNLHRLFIYVRAAELQQALETDIYSYFQHAHFIPIVGVGKRGEY